MVSFPKLHLPKPKSLASVRNNMRRRRKNGKSSSDDDGNNLLPASIELETPSEESKDDAASTTSGNVTDESFRGFIASVDALSRDGFTVVDSLSRHDVTTDDGREHRDGALESPESTSENEMGTGSFNSDIPVTSGKTSCDGGPIVPVPVPNEEEASVEEETSNDAIQTSLTASEQIAEMEARDDEEGNERAESASDDDASTEKDHEPSKLSSTAASMIERAVDDIREEIVIEMAVDEIMEKVTQEVETDVDDDYDDEGDDTFDNSPDIVPVQEHSRAVQVSLTVCEEVVEIEARDDDEEGNECAERANDDDATAEKDREPTELPPSTTTASMIERAVGEIRDAVGQVDRAVTDAMTEIAVDEIMDKVEAETDEDNDDDDDDDEDDDKFDDLPDIMPVQQQSRRLSKISERLNESPIDFGYLSSTSSSTKKSLSFNNVSSVESHESEPMPQPAASAEFILGDITRDEDEDEDEENGERNTHGRSSSNASNGMLGAPSSSGTIPSTAASRASEINSLLKKNYEEAVAAAATGRKMRRSLGRSSSRASNSVLGAVPSSDTVLTTRSRGSMTNSLMKQNYEDAMNAMIARSVAKSVASRSIKSKGSKSTAGRRSTRRGGGSRATGGSQSPKSVPRPRNIVIRPSASNGSRLGMSRSKSIIDDDTTSHDSGDTERAVSFDKAGNSSPASSINVVTVDSNGNSFDKSATNSFDDDPRKSRSVDIDDDRTRRSFNMRNLSNLACAPGSAPLSPEKSVLGRDVSAATKAQRLNASCPRATSGDEANNEPTRVDGFGEEFWDNFRHEVEVGRDESPGRARSAPPVPPTTRKSKLGRDGNGNSFDKFATNSFNDDQRKSRSTDIDDERTRRSFDMRNLSNLACAPSSAPLSPKKSVLGRDVSAATKAQRLNASCPRATSGDKANNEPTRVDGFGEEFWENNRHEVEVGRDESPGLARSAPPVPPRTRKSKLGRDVSAATKAQGLHASAPPASSRSRDDGNDPILFVPDDPSIRLNGLGDDDAGVGGGDDVTHTASSACVPEDYRAAISTAAIKTSTGAFNADDDEGIRVTGSGATAAPCVPPASTASRPQSNVDEDAGIRVTGEAAASAPSVAAPATAHAHQQVPPVSSHRHRHHGLSNVQLLFPYLSTYGRPPQYLYTVIERPQMFTEFVPIPTAQYSMHPYQPMPVQHCSYR